MTPLTHKILHTLKTAHEGRSSRSFSAAVAQARAPRSRAEAVPRHTVHFTTCRDVGSSPSTTRLNHPARAASLPPADPAFERVLPQKVSLLVSDLHPLYLLYTCFSYLPPTPFRVRLIPASQEVRRCLPVRSLHPRARSPRHRYVGDAPLAPVHASAGRARSSRLRSLFINSSLPTPPPHTSSHPCCAAVHSVCFVHDQPA